VLYVIDSLHGGGGAERSLASMVPGLSERGVELHIAYLFSRDALVPEVEANGARVHPVLRGNRAARIGALTRLVRELDVDLVHTTLFEADVAGRMAGSLGHTPVVSSIVNVAYGPGLTPPGVRRSRLLLAQVLDMGTARLVRRFHALTTHVADVMAARLRVRRDLFDVMPRGREPSAIGEPSADRRRRTRESIALDDQVPTVLVAARHEHQKGVDLAIEAFAQVRTQRPRAVLLLAGRAGGASQAIEAAMSDLSLAPFVRVLGQRHDVPDLLCAADLLLVPSRWEGQGSVIVEAMGLGTPVIASDIPPIREVIGGRPWATLVPLADTGRMASAIVAQLDRPAEERAKAAAAARAEFVRHYTADGASDCMVAFYRRALGL
jgi:glycosyltransferase involved in cell wall biosynthesis